MDIDSKNTAPSDAAPASVTKPEIDRKEKERNSGKLL